MKITTVLLSLFFCGICFSCISQEINASIKEEAQLKKDVQLANIYEKFYQNRHDYSANFGESRDTILNRFKKTLLKTLENIESFNYPFDSLQKDVKIIKSDDNKLRLFSWDELNGGTWHIYKAAYQFIEEGKVYSGFLPVDNEMYLEAVHYKIVSKIEDFYLVKAYGTHGAGNDHYVYRLLSFKDKKLIDCVKCFDGNNIFIFEKMRGYDAEPSFNIKTNTISYPELQPNIKDGEETGFTEPSGKILKLEYIDGTFVKSNN